jgi:hypothetical protein
LWIARRTFLDLGRNLAPAFRADPVEHNPIYPEFVVYSFRDIPYPTHLGTLSGLGIRSQAHLRAVRPDINPQSTKEGFRINRLWRRGPLRARFQYHVERRVRGAAD